ncbi:MAG: DUF2802 domain-containing protein [Gammaproteobacteria bacterium]|nr:hypothetical protein [Gammaproteobacteria bacterium]
MEHVELIAFISGAAIAVAFALVLSIQRGLRADLDALARKVERKAEAQDAELEALHREVGEVSAHADDIGRRVVELAEQIALLARQQEQMLLRDPDGGPYMQAVRAACSGASVEALMSSFGLSRSEAELVVTLHRPRADSDA